VGGWNASETRRTIHVADRADLEKWIANESGMPKPAHVLTGDADISAALKDSIKAVRRTGKK
jgi:hypothetical protein